METENFPIFSQILEILAGQKLKERSKTSIQMRWAQGIWWAKHRAKLIQKWEKIDFGTRYAETNARIENRNFHLRFQIELCDFHTNISHKNFYLICLRPAVYNKGSLQAASNKTRLSIIIIFMNWIRVTHFICYWVLRQKVLEFLIFFLF